MTPEQFARDVYQETVLNGLSSYQQIFGSTEKITDPFYKRALAFYNSLNDNDKAVLFEILKQVEVDTTASLLSILDGQRHEGEFILSYKAEDSKKNIVVNEEMLSDLFLEIDEVGFENFDNG